MHISCLPNPIGCPPMLCPSHLLISLLMTPLERAHPLAEHHGRYTDSCHQTLFKPPGLTSFSPSPSESKSALFSQGPFTFQSSLLQQTQIRNYLFLLWLSVDILILIYSLVWLDFLLDPKCSESFLRTATKASALCFPNMALGILRVLIHHVLSIIHAKSKA